MIKLFLLPLVLTASAAQADEVYRLRAGDKLEIWTSLDSPLNRPLTVAPDGRIAMPLVGHMPAAGFSPEQLEQQLTARLKTYFKVPIELTVILTSTAREDKAAAIYVIGSVERPGAFPFRTNMVVLHAVSAAGGFFRPAQAAAAALGGGQTDLAATVRKLEQALLKEARLKSELKGQQTIAVSGKLAEFAGKDAKDAIEQESAVLASRQAVFETQLRTRERVAAGLKEEMTALQDQVVTAGRNLDAQQKDLETIHTLVQRGLVVGTRETDAARLTGLTLAQRQDTQVKLIRAQTSHLEAVAATSHLQEQRRLEINSALQQVAQEIKDLQAKRAIVSGAAPGGYEYEIIRTVDGAMRKLQADELQVIEPDDLIRVIPNWGSDDAPGQVSGQVSSAAPG